MGFAATAENDTWLEGYTLVANLRREDGTFSNSRINVDDFLGNNNGEYDVFPGLWN
jgi:hypothetical protein